MVADLGGPTANMYGFECARKAGKGACADRSCLFPRPCPSLKVNHDPLVRLMRRVRRLPGVQRVAVASGLRHDLVLADRCAGRTYLRELTAHHVSGQLKLAPEHSETEVLRLMGKPGPEQLLDFIRLFQQDCHRQGQQRLFLTYYLMAGHPGCTERHMRALARFCDRYLGHRPRQIQIFTPTPSTWSTAMYYSGLDRAGETIFVEKSVRARQRQKEIVLGRRHSAKHMVTSGKKKKKTW
jgi:uncharacterized radical SAM protein YgiQ